MSQCIRSWFRFNLKSLFVLMLGISIGYSLNLQTLKYLIGSVSNESFMASLPTYVVEPPDILLVDIRSEDSEYSKSLVQQKVVGPDGQINLGEFGDIYVAGKTIQEVQEAVSKVVENGQQPTRVNVDVFIYNSKNYYIVEQTLAAGDRVTKYPIAGKETVLDAIAQLGGLKSPSTTQLWIARPPANGMSAETILPVVWEEIAKGISTSNYQLLPGDRLFISEGNTMATLGE